MKKWSKKKKGVVIAAGVALLGLAGIYGYQVSVYQNHFLPGTRINELDCGKMTAKEAEQSFASVRRITGSTGGCENRL